MNKITAIFLFLLFVEGLTISVIAAPDKASINNNFNAKLAKELGADDYGMKTYVLIILKTGPNDSLITDKDKRAELFKGHFANMERLAKDGLLLLAGPLIESRPKRGLLILNVKTLKEAESLVKSDPTVIAGIFDYEMTKYYGSAALMQINDIHQTIQKPSNES